MVYRYEILMLTSPYLTSLESQNIEQAVNQTVKGNEGQILSYERWGKYQLAYPVNNHDYGIYFLVRFETNKSPETLLKAINELFRIKLEHLVMRHLINKLDPQSSLEYNKPESLEATPTKGSSARQHTQTADLYAEQPTTSELRLETPSLLEEEQ